MAYTNGNPRLARRTAAERHSEAQGRHSRESARSAAGNEGGSSSASLRSSSQKRPHARSSRLESVAFAEARKKRKRKKIITGVLVVVLVLLLGGAGAAFAYMHSINAGLHEGLDAELQKQLVPADTPTDPFYVLLLGVDGSEDREESEEFGGDNFRSDSMMLARIDPKEKKVAIISIPRDIMVDLGEYGTQKINAAHFFGGPALAVKTVSEFAGVPISHYAELNFDGFLQVVDTLGGIEVDVPIVIDDPLAGDRLEAGLQTLNGAQALTLCRSRHAYDDYGSGDLYRAANQRVVLSAIAQKLLQSDPMTIATTISSLAEQVMTDLDVMQIVGIAQTMRGLDAQTDIYTASVPTESVYEDDVWYEEVDEKAWKAMMKRIEQGLPPATGDVIDEFTGTVMSTAGGSTSSTGYSIDADDAIRVRNGNGRDGVTKEAKDILVSMGYSQIDSANADSFDYPQTLIIYKESEDAEDAEQIADAFGVGIAQIDDGTFLFESDFLIVIGDDWPED